MASYTSLLEGIIREDAPVHFSLRQRLLHRFPHKYISQLLGGFLPHEFLQVHDKQDLKSDLTRKKTQQKQVFQVRSSDCTAAGTHQPVQLRGMDNGTVGRQEHRPQSQHPRNDAPWAPLCSQHSLSQPKSHCHIWYLTVFTLKLPGHRFQQENTRWYIYTWFSCQTASKWERNFEA